MSGNSSRPLRPRPQTRGVIPKKVSDLENDVKYITKDEMTRLSDISGYSGINNLKARVKIDNLEKTIEVENLVEDVRNLLPRDNSNNYIDGNYMLKATIVEGVPTIQWVTISDGGGSSEVQSPYYYGLISVSSLDEIDENLIKTLPADGLTKSNKEYRFVSKKQRQVLAYPAEFGELTKITHKETGFNITNMFEKIAISISGVDYLAYVSFNSSTGTYTYTFEY